MIESLLAVFVLSIGIVGTIGLLVSSMKNSMDARDNIIATNMAQEGTELVRNIRDNNVAAGAPSAFANIPGGNCYMSYNDPALTCGGSPTYVLNLSSGYYAHAGGTVTKFKRKIIIDDTVANQRTVTSEVIWLGAGGIFPNVANCTVAKKCVYVQAILTAR